MTTYGNQHYLIIRPIATTADYLDEYVEDLVHHAGVTHLIAKQKLTGQSLQVVKTSTDENELQEIAFALNQKGFKALVISQVELKGRRPVEIIKSIKAGANHLKLFNKHNKQVGTISKNSATLVVVSSPAIESYKMSIAKGYVFDKTPSDGVTKILDKLLRDKPRINIYASDSQCCFRIEDGAFNFNSLGDLKNVSSVQNLKTILKLVEKTSKSALMDVNFGLSTLPFIGDININKYSTFAGEFDKYSRLVYLATLKGTYKNLKSKNALSTLLPLLAGNVTESTEPAFMWAGPLFFKLNKDGTAKNKLTDEEQSAVKKFSGPSTYFRPSPMAVNHKSSFFKRDSAINYKKYGPPILMGPLITILIASLGIASEAETIEPLPVAALSLGIILYIYSFVLNKRKMVMKNIPTSKIKTMVMGEIEINGITKAKYHFNAPFSFQKCVYYSYEVYKWVWSDNKRKQVLVAWGNSGNTPFYATQDGAKVLINPKGAIMHGGVKHTFNGNNITANIAFSKYLTGDYKIVERHIPVGISLYIIGFAKPNRFSAKLKKINFIERLKKLKNNKEKLKTFDKNNDGIIDDDEWDNAKEALREVMYLESLKEKEDHDNVVVTDHPAGGLFFISDKNEEYHIKTAGYLAPLAFITGTALIPASLYWISILAATKGSFFSKLTGLF